MKKISEIIFLILFGLFLLIICFCSVLQINKTNKFNNQERELVGKEYNDKCSFNICFRGGTADSWIKKDVFVEDKICTLKGATFDGSFTNISDYEISKWVLKINITEKCYLNNAWCGVLEIHQKNKTQTVDMRNYNIQSLTLDYITIDQDLLIPLEKGDYIIYYPSSEYKELPISAYSDLPASVTIGFIFYFDPTTDFEISNYNISYQFKKSYFQGSEPRILLILFSIWLLILIIKLTIFLTYKKVKTEAEHKLNLQHLEDMKAYNSKLNEEVKNKTVHIVEMQQKVVIGLVNVIGNRDPDTGGHVKRTSDIIELLVEEFRKQNPSLIDDEKAYDICRAAPMHDLGKIYIESAILCKPGKLTDEEYEKMKKHAENSGEIVKLILKDVEEPHFVSTAFNVARFHHERWDGRGYPEKLSGENIPLEARIMAVADVYDALVSKRCYKQSLSFDKAFEIMCEGMGSQFDPQMLSIFTACRNKLEKYYTDHN